ncbi:Protein with TPR repeat, SEL1 subfamily [Spraguea lophii 42_110]|uniref:Protein with TPR repeat, SEL1 subfamily n=1 Tax=Spraguea lophii (strain 42_110) TaxID=1358809 RepID=S7WAH2_SPRLO|nr:Protein with TPR repeat, SEL1 subfamily [Spraguea lophii 42_110]
MIAYIENMAEKISSALINLYDSAFIKCKPEENVEMKFKCITKVLRILEYKREELNYKFMMNNPMVRGDFVKDKNMKMIEDGCLNFLTFVTEGSQKRLFKDSAVALAGALMGIAQEIGVFGLNKDIDKAFKYYSAASRQNNALGAFRLGLFYEKGTVKAKSYKKAIAYYKHAAKLGLIEAMHTFGTILIYGDLNSHKDTSTGLFYLKMAVKKSNEDYAYPYYDLARIFEADNNVTDIVPDNKYAFLLYEKGAYMGCPNCQYRIGRAYEFGELYQEKSLKDAVKWYLSSAELGQTDAQLGISTFYFTGLRDVIDRDYNKAYTWALKAAVKGHHMASFCVADYIENGIGIKRDITHAMWWYTISSALGNKKAKEKVQELKKRYYSKRKAIKFMGCCSF